MQPTAAVAAAGYPSLPGGSHYTINGVTHSATSVRRQMHEVNEIQYETAVAPIEDFDSQRESDYDYSLPRKGYSGTAYCVVFKLFYSW